MLTVKRLVLFSTRGGSQLMYIIFASVIRIRQNPLFETQRRHQIQNRGTSGPNIEHMYVSAKNILKFKKKQSWVLLILAS